ncbi:MAG: VacJ family lipoprotein [Lentisphaeria bacterium]
MKSFLPLSPFQILAFSLTALPFFCCLGCVSSKISEYPVGTELLLHPMADPLEGYNRSIQVFNQQLTKHLIRPVSQAYNLILPKVARDGIDNAGQNLLFPLRAVNCLLQEKYEGAWQESKRFGINSTIGILGFRDQASRWNIPLQKEDFGQTMAYYECQDGFFLNLPFLGPCSGRDAIGRILGIPWSLSFWLFSGDTAMAVSGVKEFNEIATHAELLNLFFSSQYDSYLQTRAFYKIQRDTLSQDFKAPTEPGNPDQSLGFLLLRPKDKNFFRKARHRSVLLSGSKSRMPYTCWPAENSRGIIVILPGLGGHRLSNGVTALAELLYKDQWSVLALSSSLNPDYFQHLPNPAPPGYFREDSKQLALAIKTALQDMQNHYKLSGKSCSILGFSLGALNALFLSALEADGDLEGLSIDRYLAINPPVDVIAALNRIDEFFAIPESWPAAEREAHCRELYLRIAGSILNGQRKSAVPGNIPVSLEESHFLIGLNMRFNLAETILASQKHFNQGFLKNDPAAFKKNALWAEALSLTFTDYMTKSVVPYYQEKFPASKLSDPDWLAEQSNLFSLEKSLANNPKVHIFQNENDFLISRKHLNWYKRTLGNRVLLLPEGGHLGNLYRPDYQQLILNVFR